MKCALYRHFDASDRLLYVGISISPLERLASHMQGSAWADQIATVRIEWLPSREGAETAERLAIIKEKPLHNSTHRSKPSGASDFIGAVGPLVLANALGVSFAAVRNAKWKDRIPSSWAAVVADLCREHGLSCPISAFSWVNPTDRRDCITSILEGEDA